MGMALNDITTSFEAPPEFQKIRELNPKTDYSYRPELAEKQVQKFSNLQPLKLAVTPARVFEAAARIAKEDFGWNIVVVDPHRMHIEAVAVSTLIRKKDDIAVEIRAEGTEYSLVHMRTRSRGGGDTTRNAARIKEYLSAIYRHFAL